MYDDRHRGVVGRLGPCLRIRCGENGVLQCILRRHGTWACEWKVYTCLNAFTGGRRYKYIYIAGRTVVHSPRLEKGQNGVRKKAYTIKNSCGDLAIAFSSEWFFSIVIRRIYVNFAHTQLNVVEAAL